MIRIRGVRPAAWTLETGSIACQYHSARNAALEWLTFILASAWRSIIPRHSQEHNRSARPSRGDFLCGLFHVERIVGQRNEVAVGRHERRCRRMRIGLLVGGMARKWLIRCARRSGHDRRRVRLFV